MKKTLLNNKQRQFLRKLAHTLKPVIAIANNGLSDAVLRETELTLDHHELIKVKISANDREHKKVIINQLCQKTNALLIQSIGNIAVIFRRAETPVIELPKH
ncbi:RNA-binding protein YhbY [hydrothermal vent metagenome]|uniref:RNA-binding protein YhbY n=1 Tax=hydrothermal vent metagenome TaxID=652676 RepID=A0A3B0Z5F1_9ZZZZ